MGQRSIDGYSADVEIFLLYDGKKYDVAQIGGGSMILRDPASIPAGTHVELVMRIDGNEEVEQIYLTEGADTPEQAVPFF